MTISGASEFWPGKFYDKGGTVLNVMHPDFGATGLGSADDYPAFAAALAALPTKGGIIYVPPGTYKIASNISVQPDATVGDGGYIQIVMAPGAKLKPTASVTECISFNHAVAQNAWVGVSGGVIDGSSGSATLIGIGIHAPNVKVCRTSVQNTGGEGIKFLDSLAPLYPICVELSGVYTLGCKIGIDCRVSASGLSIAACRIEESDEEGVYLQECGHFSIDQNTVIEMNGAVDSTKPNLRIKDRCFGGVVNSYFESRAYQDHSCVIIETSAQQPRAILFTGNIVTGYYETASGSGVPLTNSVGLDICPSGSGVVDGVFAYGNFYFGQHIAVRNGTFSRGFKLGPDAFSDSFDDGSAWSAATAYVVGNKVNLGTAGTNYVCILNHTNHTPPNATYWLPIGTQRYVRTSAFAGRVEDVNTYANTIYETAAYNTLTATALAVTGATTTTGLLTANGGVKFGTATSVQASIVRHASLGIAIRTIAGSLYDFSLADPGGFPVYEVPTGTVVSQFFGTIQEIRSTIVYSASMTPNADAGNIQTITATNGTAFTINAPTNPRAGTRLRIRLRNIHSGALGAITVNAVYKLVGSAWPSPLNGFSRTIEFDYDGTNWIEAYRTAADVPN